MQNFQEFNIWKKAMKIVEKIYLLSSEFPKEEKFGLTIQIRKNAISIASNKAEGAGINTNGEFREFIGNAKGSTKVLIT